MAGDEKTRILAAPDAVAVGSQLSGTYELDKRIASGGMGEVYRGHNIQTGDPVAIKIVLPEFARDATILSLFRKEASILNHLFHEAIVRYHVFAIDQTIGRPYLAMEFVDGLSLVDMFEKGPMDPEDARKLLVRLAAGLAVAHEAGVIHRDLSPDNIVLPGGKVERAKIIDFGIARSATVGGATLLGGSFAGKYNFVSPEQLGLAGGEVTERSDIYSLGLVIAAAMRAKTINMTGSQVDIIEKRRVVPDLSGIDGRMRPVLEAMLQPDPANRPQSMKEIVDGLQRVPERTRSVWETDAPQPGPTQVPAGNTGFGPSPAGEEAWPATTRTPAPWRSDAETTGRGPATGATQHVAAAAPSQGTSPPAPGARSGSGSRGGVIAASIVVLLLLGGGGAYLGGVFDPLLGSRTEETPPATNPEPQPTEPATPPAGQEPVTPTPPVAQEPAAPTPPPATEGATQPAQPPPATGNDTAPTPPPATTDVQPPATSEPTQPAAPPQDATVPTPPAQTEPTVPAQPEVVTPPVQADPLASRRDWLKAYAGGNCFFAAATGTTGDKLKIEGFGQSVQPFEAMLASFKSEFPSDPEPDIGVRLIQPKQCPATSFLHRVAESTFPAPNLVMAKDVLFDGDPMTGEVQLQPGRQTYVLLIDHDGIAHNLEGILKRAGEKATFSVQLGLGTGKGVGKAPLPQMLIALSTSAPLEAITTTAAVAAGDLLPRIEAEMADKRIDGVASARYFRIRG